MTNVSDLSLSGYAYISVRMRGENDKPSPLRIVAERNCNHGEGMACETAECLNSWSLDYQFFLRRTARGRAIIKRFHLDEDKLMILESESFRPLFGSEPFVDSE